MEKTDKELRKIKIILKFVCVFSLAAMISPYGFCDIDEGAFEPGGKAVGQKVKSGASATGRGPDVLPAGGDAAHGIWDYIKPHAMVETEWDDNIFRSQSAREKDLITTVEVGADLKFNPQPFRRRRTRLLSDIVLNVNGEAIRYMDHGSLNSNNILGDISLNGVALEDFLFYYKLGRTQRLSSDLSIDNTGSSGATQVTYWNESYGVSDKIGSGRYELLMSYDGTNTTYATADQKSSNRKSDDFDFMNSFTVMEDLQLLVDGAFGFITRPKVADNDTRYVLGTIGGNGKLGEKLTGGASVGYMRWFDEYDKITEGVVLNMDAGYDFNRRLSFFTNAGRTILDLSAGAGEEEVDIGGSISGAPGTGITIPGITNIGGGLAASTRAYVGFKYTPAFDENITFIGGFLFNRMEYSGSTRIDDIYLSTITTQYKIKNWARFLAAYTCDEKFSDAESSSYKENKVTLTLTMDF